MWNQSKVYDKKGGALMNSQEAKKQNEKCMMIQGRRVVLCFAEHPNVQVVEQIKQAILSGYGAGGSEKKRNPKGKKSNLV